MTKVNVKSAENTVTLTNGENSQLEIEKFDPSDLLAGSLAKCTTQEIKKIIRRNDLKVDNFTVRVDLDRDSESKTANFKVHLDVDGDLSEPDLRKLYKGSKKSYINRLLSNNIALNNDVHYNGNKVEL